MSAATDTGCRSLQARASRDIPAVSRPETATALSVVPKYPYRRQLPYTSSQFTPPRCARGPQLRTATPYSEFLLPISTIIPITSWGVILTAFWIPNLTSTVWSIYMSGTCSQGKWSTSHLGWWTLSGQSTPPSGSTPATQATAGTAKQGWITSLHPLAWYPTFPYTISDHHPVVAVFQCPSLILLSQPPLPPCIFRKLSSDEKQQFSNSIRLISDWCRDLQDAPARAPLEEVIAATDSLYMQVGSAYHKITRPKPQRKDQEGYGKLRKLLRPPPPPSSSAFPEHLAEVQSVVNTLRSSDETKAKRKVHSSLVRGVQMKTTVARTLCPKDLEPLVVRDPATKELLSDPAEVAKVFGDTLLHLGGHPDYAPPKDFVDEVLSHSPTCPVSAKNDHIPPVTWQEFQNHLKHSKPSKAGGPDKTNNYVLALCPEPIQRFFHPILNRFLHSPLPPHWLCAKICLLYKKGDPFSPSNYRPIALLNCIYKLLATFACKHLCAQAFAHDIISEIQHGGLPGHQCADHLYHLKALYAKSKKSYSLFIDFNKAFNSVPHGTLWTVLERANFSASTISLIKQLYSFPQDSPIINGRTPHAYLQTRGLRQGCPLSPLLFILYLNSLFHHFFATVPPPPGQMPALATTPTSTTS